jgi:hypothetical protein
MVLVSCAADMPAVEYAARAGELVNSGEEGGALEVLRSGIYRHPDDYGLNILMARTLLAHYTDLTRHARSRYLARHYLKRAASHAPDQRRAEAALREYGRLREAQR